MSALLLLLLLSFEDVMTLRYCLLLSGAWKHHRLQMCPAVGVDVDADVSAGACLPDSIFQLRSVPKGNETFANARQPKCWECYSAWEMADLYKYTPDLVINLDVPLTSFTFLRRFAVRRHF